jgi:Family of unknown function (DUF5631)/Family of unknown function (DUF5632)
VAIFGRNTARQRLRRAAQESLKIPAFRSPVDCTPWVTGGLWPAELSTVTAETAPLVKYLKADLQRIVNSANEELKNIRCAGLIDSTRQAEEARVINDARAFAVRRVESTVRHLHNMKSKLPTEYRPVNGAVDTEKTTRFKLAPPRPEPTPPVDIPVSAAPEQDFQPAPPVDQPKSWEQQDFQAAPSVDQPKSWEPEPLEDWDLPFAGPAEPQTPELETAELETTELETAEFETAAPETFEIETFEPEITERVESQPKHAFESDDTEVLEELASLLQEITPLAEPPVVEPLAVQPVVVEPLAVELPAVEPPSPVPAAGYVEPATDVAEATRQLPVVEPAESERDRLERLLKFVARQEPGLRWAVGTREDGTTLLVTDLAHGWIPPGITLPAEVTLLEPARRTGNPAALLGQTTLTAKYAPGDPLGWAADYEVTDTSSRPRELPEVDDLGWVLGEATHWRDGLPRLVNTLAKAGAAGTGIVEAEIDILRVYLDTSRYQLLAQYPDIDDGLLLNCLLLAATEGIATKNHVSANYHFAWFQLLSAPPASGWKAGP